MAIKIPQNMIFGTPNIELITDNKINKIDYDNNIISNINYNVIDPPLTLKSIFSTSVNCWNMDDTGTYYEYNLGTQNDGIVYLGSTIINGKYEYYATINLNKIKSDLYYSIVNPYGIAYIGVNYSTSAVREYFPQDITLGQRISANSITIDDISKNYVSSRTRGNDTLYTVENSPSISEIVGRNYVFDPILEFKSQPSTNYFVDEFNGNLHIHIGSISSGTSSNVGTGQAILDFSLEFYYPSFELETINNIKTNSNDNLNTTNNYTMETNSFMNSYIDINNNEINFIDNQAREIMFNYENGRLRANITCNYGQYMNDDGTLAYSGTDGKTIKVGDVVQLNLSKINKNFEVIKSEIVYSGNIRVNLTMEEESKVFGINERLGNGINVTYNRTYSELGSIGVITSKDKLYENDIIQININLTNNDIYNLDSIIVNGQNFTSGNTITISNDLNVYVSTSVKTFTISSNLDEGVSLILTRESSPYGKGSLGEVNINNTFYYGDVLIVDWKISDGYTFDNAYFNDTPIYSFSNKVTITSNSLISITTSQKSWKTIWDAGYETVIYEFPFNDKHENQVVDLPLTIATTKNTRMTFIYYVQDSAGGERVFDDLTPQEISPSKKIQFFPYNDSSCNVLIEYRYKTENENQLLINRTNSGRTSTSLEYSITKIQLYKIEQYN